uniref:VWA domain-containing protein n=1 Tax=Escherichia coli TaxID=562 RepID=UPI00203603D9|nr:VWA domain-containing protein [Escherichia coli]
MSGQFSKGNVQSVLDRIAVLAAQFDDDGEMDVWGFGEKHKKYPNVTLDNLTHIFSPFAGLESVQPGEPAGTWWDKQ